MANITNEQKAKEIAEYLNQPNGSNSLLECHQAAMAMAEWKDKQFKEEQIKLLDLKAAILDYMERYKSGYSCIGQIQDFIRYNFKDMFNI